MTTFNFMKRLTTTLALAAAAVVTVSASRALAVDYFVRDAVAERGVTSEEASAATNLVRNAVAARAGDRVIDSEMPDTLILQPRLMKLGDSWILTVEKMKGLSTIYASQAKVDRIEQLDTAARSATFNAIEAGNTSNGQVAKDAAAPYSASSPVAAAPAISPAPATVPATSPTATGMGMGRSTGTYQSAFPPGAKTRHWTLGAGPFFPHRLQNSTVMYDVAAGHIWDINPLVSVKAMAEGNFSSGSQTGTFLNFSAGANYYFREISADTIPYATADMGYGYARSAQQQTAEGFSLGVGAGFEFFRSTENSLDLLLRYNMIFDTIAAEGYPSVIGARLAVNF